MHRRGFTLIEMAIVLVVMGVITAILVPTVVNVIRREKISQGKIGVASIRDQLIGYAIDEEKLPDDAGAAPYAGVADLGNPVDVWGKSYAYRVNPELDKTTLEANSKTLCDMVSTNTAVQDGLQVTNSGGTVKAVAFVAVSGGPDGVIDTDLTDNTSPYVVDIQSTAVDDDLVEYVTLTHLKALLNCGTTGGSGGGDIGGEPQVTFADNIDEFNNPTNNDAIGGINVDQTAKTITLQHNYWGETSSCIWYEGDNADGDCTSGNCDFDKSIMVYFKFKSDTDMWDQITTGMDDGGFTFALISTNDIATYLPCGSKDAADLGFAGYRSGTDAIDPPKIAVEFDLHPSGNDKGEFADTWYTDIRRHYGIVYWGNTNTDNDDNRHGDDGDSDGGANPAFLTTGDYVGYAATDAIYKFDNHPSTTNQNIADDWFTDTREYETRIQFTKDGSVVNATAWLRRDPSDTTLSDMTSPYSSDGNYKIFWSKTFPAETIAKLGRVRFGWTMSRGQAGGNIVISDFALRFD
ncbi:MAG: type II secretion system protein [Desulfovibrionaceae bacterium]|nr:type II secretion system protein [Desulfovibrionaceae bacterium]